MIGTQGEQGYLDMLRRIMAEGTDKSDRTGTGTREVFGNLLRFDMSDGTIPVMTTKSVAWKTAFKEMLWMLSGSGNIRPLLEQNVRIWSEWPHARYVRTTGDGIDIPTFEARVLEDQKFADEWGDTGGAYGVQWRRWPTYIADGSDERGTIFRAGPGHDQVQEVLDAIKGNPDSRRIRFTAWNAPLLSGMMLPPCHAEYQFQTDGGRLNLALTIRSWDVFLGGPFNIANAGMLLQLMAMHTGMEVGSIAIFSVCTHIYSNHFDQVATQLERTPTALPRLRIAGRASLFDHRIEDFELEGYAHQGKISAPVAV
jgi:thymidylate synthase